MKIGVSIGPLLPPLQDLQESGEIIFAKEIGINHIELHTNFIDDFLELILELSERFGMEYSIHCPHMYFKIPTNFCSARPSAKKTSSLWLEKSIEYAKQIKAKTIVIHADKPEKCSKETAKDILELHIRKAIPLLDKNQFILIENMPGKDYTLSTPAEVKEFLKRFRKSVGACWDVGHGTLGGHADTFEFPKELKKKIKEVHISGIRKKGKGFSDHFPIDDKNVLDLRQFRDELSKIRFRGPVVMEIITHDPLDIIESRKALEKVSVS